MDKVGFLLFLLGAAGMDSPDRTIATIMGIAGIIILKLSTINEKAFHQKADQSNVKSLNKR